MSVTAVIILAIALGAQIFLRSFSIRSDAKFRIVRVLFFSSLIIVAISNFYWSYKQYQIWHYAEPPVRFLLPPYQPINYFLNYVLTRIWVSYFVSFAAALIFFFTAKFLNRKSLGRFFEPEEPYFGALAVFLVSHPGWIFYLTILTTLFFLFSIFHFLFSKKSERLSLYYLWLPTAIFVILIVGWLERLSIWQVLKI